MSSEVFGMVMAGIIVFLVLSGCIGYRQMKKANRVMAAAEEKLTALYPGLEVIGSVAYQGGLPQFPKPAVLQLAVSKGQLVLYNASGFSAGIPGADWQEIEKFTVRQKADNRGRSSFLLGPFGSLFYKDKFRSFISIRYTDINCEENHILLELRDKTNQSEFYDKLSEWHSNFRGFKAQVC